MTSRTPSGPDKSGRCRPADYGAKSCVLLFGDSFTFGTGVGDEETYAAQIVTLSGRKVAVHNLRVGGWGPHQLLAGLQSGRFQNAVRCKPSHAVFLMIPSHIWRVAGVTTARRRGHATGWDLTAVRSGMACWAKKIQTTGGDGSGGTHAGRQGRCHQACSCNHQGSHGRAEAHLSRHPNALHFVPSDPLGGLRTEPGRPL